MKNIGIIGCGKIAQTRHIPEYMDNQDSRLAAFYDVNAERARFLAKKYGGRAYGTYRELLQDKEIDAVSVCVPNELHAQINFLQVHGSLLLHSIFIIEGNEKKNNNGKIILLEKLILHQ